VRKIGSGREKCFQKPYSSSPGVGSQRRQFRRPARPLAGARERSGWSLGDGGTAVRRDKTLAVDLIRFSVADDVLI
jgi:hypothetical protein